MSQPEERECINAIKSGQPGADMLAVLPLSGKQRMLLGIEPHGGLQWRRKRSTVAPGHWDALEDAVLGRS